MYDVVIVDKNFSRDNLQKIREFLGNNRTIIGFWGGSSVMSALDARRIRHLDILLVTKEQVPPTEVNFASYQPAPLESLLSDFCQSLSNWLSANDSINYPGLGVAIFRLPQYIYCWQYDGRGFVGSLPTKYNTHALRWLWVSTDKKLMLGSKIATIQFRACLVQKPTESKPQKGLSFQITRNGQPYPFRVQIARKKDQLSKLIDIPSNNDDSADNIHQVDIVNIAQEVEKYTVVVGNNHLFLTVLL